MCVELQSIGNIYKGLAQSGAWGCFDEFNRISVEVLSVVAVQVKCIQDAIRDKKKMFVFLGEDIKLNATVGLFITMNPGESLLCHVLYTTIYYILLYTTYYSILYTNLYCSHVVSSKYIVRMVGQATQGELNSQRTSRPSSDLAPWWCRTLNSSVRSCWWLRGS